MSFSEWKEVNLEDISINITDGKHGDCKNEENSGYYFVSVKDIFDEMINYENARQITKEDFEETHRRTKLEKNDILITNTGTIGRMALVRDNDKTNKTTFQKSVAIVKPNQSIVNSVYLYYCIKSDIANLSEYAGGTTQKNLLLRDIRKFKIRYPSLIEQKAIAKTLSCLDSKIELNNHMNKTLGEMAQAIFKSWFVDFEPFQDGEFEDSELGMIPNKWSVKALYDFAEYINGTSFKKDEYDTSGYPIIKITELKNGITSSTQYFSGTKDKKYYIKTGDILFSWSGNPQTSIDTFIWVGGDAILNQHTFRISIKNNDYCFIYLLLKFFKPEFTRIASSKQTTGLGHVTISDLKRMKFPYDNRVVAEFCTMLTPVIEMYVKNLLENKKLKDIRDSLLPKLMSGEIRVPIEEV